MLVAGGMALGLDGLAVARGLGLAAGLLSVVLFLQLARRTLATPEIRGLATLAWAGHAWMIRWTLSGMETPLAVALVLAGVGAFTRGPRGGARPARTRALWALAPPPPPQAGLLLGGWGAVPLAGPGGPPRRRRRVDGLPP